jgi:tetratricopeptide (TPR) repeat protein
MKKHTYFICIAFCCCCMGCKKYLDIKPDTALAIPVTATDFQALIDNIAIMNFGPGGGEISSGDYYLTDADYNALTTDDYKRGYIWQKDHVFSILGNNDWYSIYRPIFTCNTVLEGISKADISPADQSIYNDVKGQAYYIRAQAFYQAADLWAPAYDDTGADTQLGIPIRLGTDFNQKSVRSTVAQSYIQIVGDLKSAIPLLPPNPIHPIRASKTAAYALLARVYLAMRKYDNAGKYADSSLQIASTLIDYNKLSVSAAFPFTLFNVEVIRETKMPTPAPLSNAVAKIDPQLYASYADNDLRKKLYFKANSSGTFSFKGSYEGSRNLFSGVAIDEMYLIRAECYARSGKLNEALADINGLLIKRYKTGTFTPIVSTDAVTILNDVLSERRKELLMRGLRWMDLKRLNKEGYKITLNRQVNGTTYSLPPNDLRYALSIPEDIIQLTGMIQNPR